MANQTYTIDQETVLDALLNDINTERNKAIENSLYENGPLPIELM